ncbi:BNR-4 repeat-containing protein [Paraglaciecola algarum]|nr:BNR-4 repeat-containing protein [Paraglaciecola sp. G1-23]
MSLSVQSVNAEVTLEVEIKIADNGLHFDGVKVAAEAPDNGTDKFDYHFGKNISAHGDAVKTYKNFVFMTWYRGGKFDRHMMLSRYNKSTGVVKTIEFPHRHTGYRGVPTIGESHNTIGLSVSPINGTIHMVFDMHAYDDNNYFGRFKDDFFRYTYSVAGAAGVSDDEFTLELFVKDTSSISQGNDDYKHLTMTGDLADKSNFARLTYPKFFVNTDGTLLLYMRLGGNNNGAYVFNRYDAGNQKWSTFTQFNEKDQKSKGNAYNWGLYGNMKYVNGKLRVGFQQRSGDNTDKFIYQNGIYYAYSDHPEGVGQWKNHQGTDMTWPLVNSDEIKIFEPGDLVEATDTSDNSGSPPGSVYIVGGFDWTVTAKGDVHFIHKVQDRENDKTVYGHTYKPVGATEFVTSTDFSGASNIYTAGDDIYIVGLSGGYPYVEKAIGGTNNFTRVYEQKTGTKFDHGTVYIENGKIYYYLMEQVTGTENPLHLQIIDLGIAKASVTFDQAELTVVEGYQNLTISAQPAITDLNRTIASVALYLGDELVSTLNAEPFQWSQAETKLQNLAIGSYAIKAVVTDNFGQTVETIMSLKVVDPTPVIAFEQGDISVFEGYDNLSLGVAASSPITSRTIAVELFVNDTSVRVDDTAPFEWGHSEALKAELLDYPVGKHTVKAVVSDSEGLTAEATIQLVVAETVVAPTLSFTKGEQTLTAGYSDISLAVDASTSMTTRTVKHVSLYLDDVLVSEDLSSPYEWTQSSAALVGLAVGSYTVKAIVTDSGDSTVEATATLTVVAAPPEPTPTPPPAPVTPPASNQGGSSGGGSLNLFLLLSLLAVCFIRRNSGK